MTKNKQLPQTTKIIIMGATALMIIIEIIDLLDSFSFIGVAVVVVLLVSLFTFINMTKGIDSEKSH